MGARYAYLVLCPSLARDVGRRVHVLAVQTLELVRIHNRVVHCCRGLRPRPARHFPHRFVHAPGPDSSRTRARASSSTRTCPIISGTCRAHVLPAVDDLQLPRSAPSSHVHSSVQSRRRAVCLPRSQRPASHERVQFRRDLEGFRSTSRLYAVRCLASFLRSFSTCSTRAERYDDHERLSRSLSCLVSLCDRRAVLIFFPQLVTIRRARHGALLIHPTVCYSQSRRAHLPCDRIRVCCQCQRHVDAHVRFFPRPLRASRLRLFLTSIRLRLLWCGAARLQYKCSCGIA